MRDDLTLGKMIQGIHGDLTLMTTFVYNRMQRAISVYGDLTLGCNER